MIEINARFFYRPAFKGLLPFIKLESVHRSVFVWKDFFSPAIALHVSVSVNRI